MFHDKAGLYEFIQYTYYTIITLYAEDYTTDCTGT